MGSPKKSWYADLDDNIVKFRQWLPHTLDVDFNQVTLVALRNTATWKLICKKIDKLHLYPIDLQRVVQNCAEIVEFGQCFQIATAADSEKRATRFLTEFKHKFSENELSAIEWLHSIILNSANKRYSHYSAKNK